MGDERARSNRATNRNATEGGSQMEVWTYQETSRFGADLTGTDLTGYDVEALDGSIRTRSAAHSRGRAGS